MYEELMVLWKIRCRNGKLDFADRLMDLGFYHYTYMGVSHAPKTGEYVWLLGQNGTDCLVGGVMLFTWEQGMEP